MIIPVRKVTNFANIIPMTHTVCTLYKQHLLFQTKAAMFKVQMNDKPNLALIKNEAQICKNCPLRLVTITAILITHLSTVVAWREKKFKHFVFYKYFSLVLGVLKSKVSKKSFESLLRKLDFNLFHYKARVQPVSKITTIATRNRC